MYTKDIQCYPEGFQGSLKELKMGEMHGKICAVERTLAAMCRVVWRVCGQRAEAVVFRSYCLTQVKDDILSNILGMERGD